MKVSTKLCNANLFLLLKGQKIEEELKNTSRIPQSRHKNACIFCIVLSMLSLPKKVKT